MLALRKTKLLVLALFLIISLSASGAVIFEDNFEAENIGDEPSLWNMVAGFSFEVVDDPESPGNKVLAENGEGNGLGVPTPADWENQTWTDYIWEFDWMWDADVYAGTAHRYQDAQHYLHSSRREGGANLIIYNWDGNWNELDNQPWSSEVGVWYRMQISDIGNQHIVKGKERGDDTPFDDLDPIVSADDNTYAEGPIGLFGVSEGTLYWDNIIVYEPGTVIGAVEPSDKLAVTWGKTKVVD